MAQELKLALLGKQNLVIRHLLNRKRINFVINFRPPGLPASVSVPVSTVFWRGAEPFTPFSAPLRISTYTDIQCRWAVAHVSLDAKAKQKTGLKALRLYKPWRTLGSPPLQHWSYSQNSDFAFEQGVEKNTESALIPTSVQLQHKGSVIVLTRWTAMGCDS